MFHSVSMSSLRVSCSSSASSVSSSSTVKVRTWDPECGNEWELELRGGFCGYNYYCQMSRMRSEMYVGILVLVKILLHFWRLSQPQRRLVTSTLPGSQEGRTLPSSARTPNEKLKIRQQKLIILKMTPVALSIVFCLSVHASYISPQYEFSFPFLS